MWGGIWDGRRRISIVVDADPILLFSVSPETRQAVVVTIPGNVMLVVPYGYKAYPANAVYKLGRLDKERGGGFLLSKAVENTMGVAIEGFFGSKNTKEFTFPDSPDKLVSLKRSYFSLPGILPAIIKFQSVAHKLETNLRTSDILRIWNAIRNLRSDEIRIINIRETHVTKGEKLPDGTVVANIDQDLLDQLLATYFQDKMVRAENITLEVVNATGQEKLASQFSRILQNLGANVVVKSTAAQEEEGNCKVNVTKHDVVSSIIVERLKKLYDCKIVESKELGISDIKVVLGEDFIK